MGRLCFFFIQATFTTTSGEHLLVLRFFDAFEGETLDGFFFVGTFAQRRLAAGYARRLAGIARDTGRERLIFHEGVGEVESEKFGASAGEIVIGDVGAGATVDRGELAGAAFNVSAADAAGTFAVHKKTSVGGVVDIHGCNLFSGAFGTIQRRAPVGYGENHPGENSMGRSGSGEVAAGDEPS